MARDGQAEVVSGQENVKALFFKADLNLSQYIYLRYLHKL